MVTIPSINNPAQTNPTSNPNQTVSAEGRSAGTFSAFRPPEAKSRQTGLYVLLGALFVLAAAVGLYFFVDFGSITLQSSPIPPTRELNTTEIRVSRLSGFNFDVINLDIYKALKLHGDIPIKVEALGRTNPFAPF